MKMKYITAIAAFALTFGVSALLIGVPQQHYTAHTFAIRADRETARQISFLLQQDDDNGREMDINSRFADSNEDIADAVNEYVNRSEAIDDARLPADFRNVWQAHMQAWRAQADFLKQSNLSDEAIADDDFIETYRFQKSEIERTWFDVLGVAEEYGAVIPTDAY